MTPTKEQILKSLINIRDNTNLVINDIRKEYNAKLEEWETYRDRLDNNIGDLYTSLLKNTKHTDLSNMQLDEVPADIARK